MNRALALCAAAVAACAAPQPKPAPVASPTPSGSATAAPAEAGQARPQGTPDAPFRAQPPPPGPAVVFRAPEPKQLQLSNGLKVFFIERHEVPLVTVQLALSTGADTEPNGKAGLASLVLDLLDEGTATRDAAAIARAFEDLAARYQTQPDADSTHLRFTALASTFDAAVEIFADVALHPAFRATDVERVRVQRLGQIAQALDDPATVGQHVLSRVVFGDRHPWAFPAEGTVRSIKAISRKDLMDWHAANFQPRNAALFVVGDADESTVLASLEKRFGGWKNGSASKLAQRKPPQAKRRVVYVVDKPDAPQSQIWVGELGVASGAPDVFPARVMNTILGGSFNSRLNGNLRTEHAYSYGAFSFYDTHRDAGPFVASAGVVAEKTAEALGEFVKELERMKKGDATEAELNDAKESLVRAIPALFASNDATAGAFARAWSHGLPADYYANYQRRVQEVTSADVAKAARERLHPDTVAIVVVGPLKAIQDKIASLGVGPLEIRDVEGEAIRATAAAAGSR